MNRDLKHALFAFAAAVLLTGLLGLIGAGVGFVKANIAALVAVVFLLVPYGFGYLRGEDLVDYGLHFGPVRRGLLVGGIPLLIILPPYAVGFYFFFDTVCHGGGELIQALTPPTACQSFLAWDGPRATALDLDLAEWLLGQLIVTALPEELLFRGFIQNLLEKVWPPKRRVLGGGIGLALVVSSLLFALVHLVLHPYPYRLAVFFPSLLFGWMYSATRSVFASTMAHFASNACARILELIYLGP